MKLLLTVLTLAALAAGAGWPVTVFAGPAASGAAITGTFSNSCRTFEGFSSKDISHVEISYSDGRVIKEEGIDGQRFLIEGAVGDEIDLLIVKSGTSRSEFNCVTGPITDCSDGVDNDGNGDTDWPADQGCSGPDDNDEGFD